MSNSNWTRREGLIAGCLFGALLLSAAVIFYAMARFGISGWIRILPPASWDGVLVTDSFLLYMISFTDWPEAIRRSAPIRAALQCWCFWYASSPYSRPWRHEVRH